MIRINEADTIGVNNGGLEAMAEGKTYSFSKDQIEEIVLITTDKGPFYDDMGLAVRIDENTAFMIMSEHPLYERFLFEELKNIVEIDYKAVIEASACVQNNVFSLYRRQECKAVYQQKAKENKTEEEQKKLREKEEKEQASLKKMHRIEIKVETICLNVVWIIGTLVSLWSAIRYLIMPERTAHDNEQMVMSILGVIVLAFLIWLTNWGGDMLMDKFLAWVAEIKEKKSNKEQKRIKDLNAALHALSQKNGVVIWDTLWAFPIYLFTFGLLFLGGENTPLALGIIVFSLVMLFGGHYVGTRIWNRHKYEKRLLKYTKQYLDIVDEQAYLKSIDESIQRGVLGFSGLWLLTDEYVVGRLSDIAFQVVAIPRKQLTYCTFFFLKRIVSDNIPVGVLQCHLKGGVDVDMEIGRGDVCNQVLRMLNTYKIPWEKKETKFT